jgi:hypothetical protein
VSVPVFLSPTACHLPIHLLAVVSVRPTLHQRERMGWWGGGCCWSEREEAWVVFRSEGGGPGVVSAIVADEGVGVGGRGYQR